MRGIPIIRQVHDAFARIISANLKSYNNSSKIARDINVPYGAFASFVRYLTTNHVRKDRCITYVSIFILMIWYFRIDVKKAISGLMGDMGVVQQIKQYYGRRMSQWYTELNMYKHTKDEAALNRVIADMGVAIREPVFEGGTDGPVQRTHDQGDRETVQQADQ